MLAVPSDMHITPRWILSMAGDAELLEEHTLVLRDGRILDILPSQGAAERYAPRVCLQRPAHLLMPGLVNAHTLIEPLGPHASPQHARDAATLGIARMLRSGVTAFCAVGHIPSELARAAELQGMRAVVGLPIAEHPSPWARNAGEYLTRALKLRDAYKGHPSVSTAFAPLRAHALEDSTLARIGTLAAELDAATVLTVHDSRRDIDACVARHGLRPIARLESLGMLSPALLAAHTVHLESAEIELLRRAGVGMVFGLADDLARGEGVPPIAALLDSGARPLRVGLGSGDEISSAAADLWTEIKLLALHAGMASPRPLMSAHGILAAATCAGAAVLGLDAEIGTLEPGKWADLCCLDLAAPAMQPPLDPARQVVLAGGRDLVSDVWVAGRQLLCEGRFTRLDWADLAARLKAPAAQARMADSA